MKKIFLGILSIVNLVIAIVIYAVVSTQTNYNTILLCIEILVGLLFIEFPVVLFVLNYKNKTE